MNNNLHTFSQVDYIKKYGYESEEHVIESADGFVTTIYRVLPPQKGGKDGGKPGKRGPPVLIEGGIFCSSDVMVLKGPGRDIGTYRFEITAFIQDLNNFGST